MPEKWTGELLGKMHNAKISRKDIAEELGVTKAWVSMVLNGHRTSLNARQNFEDAFERVRAKRKE